jgi:hypothetical protein
VSQSGEIPVYEQFLGLSLGAQTGPLQIALLVRGHDARFDIFRESGFTIDAGAAAEPLPHLRLGASTQFVPADFSTGRVERYFGAVEYSPFTVAALGTTRLLARYGAALRDRRHLEHHVGIGTRLGSVIGVDAGLVRERTSTSASWRAIVAISVRAGRYRVLAARGGGLADVGANYRVGLDVDLFR